MMPKPIFIVVLVACLTLLHGPAFARKFPALADSQRITMLQPPIRKPVSMSDLVHSPIVTDNNTFSFDQSRHLIRCVNFVQRDPIFRDFFTKLQKRAGR